MGFLEFLDEPDGGGLFARYGGKETALPDGVARRNSTVRMRCRLTWAETLRCQRYPESTGPSCSTSFFSVVRRLLLLPCRHPALHPPRPAGPRPPDLDPQRVPRPCGPAPEGDRPRSHDHPDEPEVLANRVNVDTGAYPLRRADRAGRRRQRQAASCAVSWMGRTWMSAFVRGAKPTSALSEQRRRRNRRRRHGRSRRRPHRSRRRKRRSRPAWQGRETQLSRETSRLRYPDPRAARLTKRVRRAEISNFFGSHDRRFEGALLLAVAGQLPARIGLWKTRKAQTWQICHG